MSLNRKPKTIDPNEVDPSIYYYDEVYDEMKNDEDGSSGKANDRCDSKTSKRESKYINKIIETVDQRNSEKEIRKFKKYARDREQAEAEGGLDDTDVYITPSYQRKLEEIKRFDEAKRRRLEFEQVNVMNFTRQQSVDVDKPKDQRKENPGDEDRHDDTHSPKGSKPSPKSRHGQNVTEQQAQGHQDTDKESSSKKVTCDTVVPVKRPKTLDERREYLREVLAKRTVGDKFDEAVRRYQERKATATQIRTV